MHKNSRGGYKIEKENLEVTWQCSPFLEIKKFQLAPGIKQLFLYRGFIRTNICITGYNCPDSCFIYVQLKYTGMLGFFSVVKTMLGDKC